MRHAQDNDLKLHEISLEQLQSFSDLINADVFDVLSLEGSVGSRNHVGGTAPEQVEKAVREARQRLADHDTAMVG